MSNAGLKPLAVTYAEAGRMLGICPRVVYRLVKDKELAAAKIGRSVRIPVVAVEEYLLRQAQQHRSDS